MNSSITRLKPISLTLMTLWATLLSWGLSGCGNSSTPNPAAQAQLQGSVMGGRQPIVGSAVYVFSASGQSNSGPVLIGSALTGSDGTFNIAQFSPQPSSGDLIYAVAISGDAGARRPNPNAILMGLAGVQGSALSQIQLNELTSTATVSKFKSLIRMSACNSISGNSGDVTGSLCPVINGQAQANWSTWVAAAAGLVNAGSGQVSTSNGNDIGLLNLQASVLANCINSFGLTSAHTACGDLYSATTTSFSALGTEMAVQKYPKQVAVSADGQYVHVVNYNSASVSSFRNDAGQLTWLANTTTGTHPASIALSPDGQFAYVVNPDNPSISSYRINAGVLTPVVAGDLNASTIASSATIPQKAIISRDGNYLFVVDISISNSIFVYQAVSGVLTEMTSSTLALSNTVFDMVMSPDGQYLYAALLYGQGVVALGHSSGVLTELVTYPATARTQYMAMSPDGRFLYVSKDAYFNQAANLGQVTVYGVQAGVLSEIAGSPFNVSGYPKGLAVSPDGSWVAIANPANKSTDLYQSNQGSLSFVQSISSTTPSASTRAAQFIAFSPNGQYLFTSASNGATNTGALLADSVPSTPSNTLSALVNMQAAPSGTASSIYSMAPSPLVFAPIPASAPATLSLP